MSRSIVFGSVISLVFLFVAGCGSSGTDIQAARDFVKHWYNAPHVTLEIAQVEVPEYASIPKIPRDHLASWAADQSAGCGVRVRFTYRTGNSTNRDDCVVWVSSDHHAVGWSHNPSGEEWRAYVRSLAK